MTPILLLVHGWGFGPSFWDPLRAALPGEDCIVWDLGFRGQASRPPPPGGREVVAVGHSFGLLWLMRHRPFVWRALVSINGFPRFTRSPDFPAGVAPRLLGRMIDRFDLAPAEVYGDFMARAGLPDADDEGLDLTRLKDGLTALGQWDCRGQSVDLALAGRHDPIAPALMTETGFAGSPIEWHDGGHLLPLEAPDWCAHRLRRFLDPLP